MRSSAEVRQQLTWAAGMAAKHHHPYDAGYVDALAWALGEQAPSKGPGASEPPSGREVRAEVEVAAPPERVIQAFLDPADLAAWWGADGAHVEPRMGGAWAAAWERTPAGTKHVMSGIIAALGPHHLTLRDVVYVQPEHPLFGCTRLDIQAEPAPGGARVRVVERGYGEGPAWDWAYEATLKGWPRALEGLRRHLGR